MLKFASIAAVLAFTGYVAVHVSLDQAGKGRVDTAQAVRDTRADSAPMRVAVAQPSGGSGSVTLQQDSRGHFTADTSVNGGRLSMLVDTGASVIALSHEDAARAGVHPNPADYRIPIATANGSINAAAVKLREVKLDRIVLRDVDAVVMPQGRLKTSLLGMSFLQRLSGFTISNGTLVLRQ